MDLNKNERKGIRKITKKERKSVNCKGKYFFPFPVLSLIGSEPGKHEKNR
jgi:hypothetical protein